MTAGLDLSAEEFHRISELVYRRSGISLKPGKEALVRARLAKRMRGLGIERVQDYLARIEAAGDDGEIAALVDVMTTNKTSFFREMAHFDFLRERVIPSLAAGRLRLWSAACSSGEEPYSIAMLLCECLPGIGRRDVRILATDISRRMLEKARRGVYPAASLSELPAPAFRRHFLPSPGGGGEVQVGPEAAGLVHFAHLNLMEPWPMRGPFQVIFCRNVMIYFDRPTQQRLVNRFWDYLTEGGYLFVGHSEGLSAITHRFRYVRPAVYQK